MVKVLRIYLDQTFTEKNAKIEQDKLILKRSEKDYTPEFSPGRSVFKERPFPIALKMIKFWKKRRTLILLLDGQPKAVTLDPPEAKDDKEIKDEDYKLSFSFGTLATVKRFIYKLVAKSKAEQKPISNIQFTILAIFLGIIVVFQLLIMKGVTF